MIISLQAWSRENVPLPFLRRRRFSVVGRCIIFDHFLENDGDARNYEAAFCSAGYDTRYFRNPSVKV